jgi:hypothetical protein
MIPDNISLIALRIILGIFVPKKKKIILGSRINVC